jgi:alpha-L-fucosidase 2
MEQSVLVCLFARLKKGEEVYNHLRLLFEKSTLPNLLDSHPPFQIDGNFGGRRGLLEMLLQSHEGYISVCPALSKRFASGSFRGLRARGGFTVDAAWDQGVVKEVRVISDFGGDVTLRLPDGRKIPLRCEKKRTYTVK